jgi:hypothetical protein
MDSDAALSYNDDDSYSSLPILCLDPYHTRRWSGVAIVSYKGCEDKSGSDEVSNALCAGCVGESERRACNEVGADI